MSCPRRLALAALTACVALSGAGSARAEGPVATRVVKGPYVTNFSDTEAEIRFELDGPGAASVEVAREGARPPPLKFTDGSAASMHVVRATGLEPARSYVYGVWVGGQVVARGNLATAPTTDAPSTIRYTVYGDDRSDPTAHAAVVRAITRSPSGFLINTGDMVEDGGSLADWKSFFDVEAPLLRERPLLLCIGNHELYNDQAGATFARYFGYADPGGTPRLYGTTRVGNSRFFFLNAMHDWNSGEERDWLTRALSAADDEPGLVWRVAVTHHGPWSSGPHGPNARLVAAHVPELLAAHKVDLLVAGHDHIYERGDSGALKYLITGGGGAPLYRATHPTAATRKAESTYNFVQVTATTTDLRLVAYRLDGSELDRCGFRKGAPWDCDRERTPPPAAPPPPPDAPAPAPKASSRCDVAPAPGTGPGGEGGLAALGLLGVIGVGLGVRRRRG